MIVTCPASDADFKRYFEFRWRMLRAPWQQPLGSERDQFDPLAYHVMVENQRRDIIGVGRLHPLSTDEAQIRYMAVAPEWRGRGVGTRILTELERQAIRWSAQRIVLNARDNALEFYQRCGYEVTGPAPTLFGTIAHHAMAKRLAAA